MHLQTLQFRFKTPTGSNPYRRRIRWGRACACLAFAASLGCVAQDGSRPAAIPQATDANAQMQQHDQTTTDAKFEAANAERRKQIANDSNQLLALAIALKAEVDKTTRDTLSLNVIRKADEIEKLAHGLKGKMKMTVGGS